MANKKSLTDINLGRYDKSIGQSGVITKKWSI